MSVAKPGKRSYADELLDRVPANSPEPIIRVERRELIAEIYPDADGERTPIHAAFLALADVISNEPQVMPSRFEFRYNNTLFAVETKPVTIPVA